MIRMLALSTLVLVTAASVASAAAVSYSGGTYSQNFNGLPIAASGNGISTVISGIGPHDFPTTGFMASAGMEGWTMSNHAGSSADTEYRAHNGIASGNAGRGVVSFGTNGSSERALGVLATSNQISRFGLAFVNDSNVTYDEFTIEFTGEQWRRGNVASPGNSIAYAYGITSNPLHNINTNAIFTGIGSFTSPNTQASPTEVALDGNLPANQVPVSALVTGVNWTPGSTLFLRWTGQDLSGQDDGLSIDNVGFTARSSAVVPEPASLALVGLAICGLSCGLRRRK